MIINTPPPNFDNIFDDEESLGDEAFGEVEFDPLLFNDDDDKELPTNIEEEISDRYRNESAQSKIINNKLDKIDKRLDAIDAKMDQIIDKFKSEAFFE